MKKEIKKMTSSREVLFKGIEGNYLICDLIWEPYKVTVTRNGKTYTKKFKPRKNNQKVAIENGNEVLIEKIKNLPKRKKVVLLYTFEFMSFSGERPDKYELDDVILIDVFTLDEWEERRSRKQDEHLKKLLKDFPNSSMFTSLERKELSKNLNKESKPENKKRKYNKSLDGKDFIKEYKANNIKNISKYNYYHIDKGLEITKFYITKLGTPSTLFKKNFAYKLNYEQLIKLIQEEEQKGNETLVYLEK